MPQLFAPRANALFRLAIACAVFGTLGAVFVAETYARSDLVTGGNEVLPQPIPFSHQHHAGELGIPCLFCHSTVRVSASAGMPATDTCMHCHSQIWTHAPMLAPVRDSFASDQPIVWNRVYNLPGYVYFNHAIHIAKGVGCSSCHGRMDRMQMTRQAHVFTMQFCVTCHENPTSRLRPQSQIFDMAWRKPADQARIGAALVARYHVDLSGRLKDCSTCHR